jgi:hypothetical protein
MTDQDGMSITVRKGTNYALGYMYGGTVYHFACEKSAIFCQIFNTKALTPEHITKIQALGFDVYQSCGTGYQSIPLDQTTEICAS